MLKVLLSLSMILNFNVGDEDFKVNKIEYRVENTTTTLFILNIELYSKYRDLIEMRIYFCDFEKLNCSNDYFSSSLTVEGNKKTSAKVPHRIDGGRFLNIIFLNENGENEIDNIFFPIYPEENNVCYLTKVRSCSSKYPSNVIYINGEIHEEKSKIFLINENVNFYSFNNTIPLDMVKISANFFNYNGYSNAYMEEEVETFDLYYDNGYLFPLSVGFYKNVVNLSFENGYYLDIISGVVYEEYQPNTRYLKQVILPYYDGEYIFSIDIVNCFPHFESVILDLKIIVEGNLIGNCNSSKYCLRRNYI